MCRHKRPLVCLPDNKRPIDEHAEHICASHMAFAPTAPTKELVVGSLLQPTAMAVHGCFNFSPFSLLYLSDIIICLNVSTCGCLSCSVHGCS